MKILDSIEIDSSSNYCKYELIYKRQIGKSKIIKKSKDKKYSKKKDVVYIEYNAIPYCKVATIRANNEKETSKCLFRVLCMLTK